MTEQLQESPAPTSDLPSVAGLATASMPISVAAMARVDLLPPEIVRARRLRRTKRRVMALVAASVLVASVAVVTSRSSIGDIEAELAAAQAVKQQQVVDQRRYADVPRLEAEAAAAVSARAAAMNLDVLWHRYLDDLQAVLPAGVSLGTVSANLTETTTPAGDAPAAGQPAPAAAGGAVLTPSGVGTLQLSGTAQTYRQVAVWLNALETVTGVTGAQLTAVSRTEGLTSGPAVTFEATAVLSGKALSQRYSKEG